VPSQTIGTHTTKNANQALRAPSARSAHTTTTAAIAVAPATRTVLRTLPACGHAVVGG
jgi:hypothetical protein